MVQKQTRGLATDMLNDWEAIFRVLQVPDLPFTNNEAERALRPWQGQSCDESPMARLPKMLHGSLLPFDQRHRNLSQTTAITLDLFGRCNLPSHSAGLAIPKLPLPRSLNNFENNGIY
ncbi:MAG: IS66 family transposase [Methylococcales bacterium]